MIDDNKNASHALYIPYFYIQLHIRYTNIYIPIGGRFILLNFERGIMDDRNSKRLHTFTSATMYILMFFLIIFSYIIFKTFLFYLKMVRTYI